MARQYTLTIGKSEPCLAGVAEVVAVLMGSGVEPELIEKAIDLPIGESIQHETLFIARVEET